MKKFFLGFASSLLITIPLIAFSADSLSTKLKGKILLAVEDKGKTYYVNEDGNRYRITVSTAQKIFEKLALGITNENLSQIPESNVGIDPEENSTQENCAAQESELNDWKNLNTKNENTLSSCLNTLTSLKDSYADLINKYEDCIGECNYGPTVDALIAQNNELAKQNDELLAISIYWENSANTWKAYAYGCTGYTSQ